MFGAYKRYRNEFAGVLTGKGLDWGVSIIIAGYPECGKQHTDL